MEHYDEAIKLSPNEVLYYNNKAAAYIEMGEFEKALEEVGKAEALIQQGLVKEYLKKAKIYSRKASVLSKLERFDEAIQWYEKSLVEDNNPAVKDELSKVKKLKKEADARAYVNPELAEKHCE